MKGSVKRIENFTQRKSKDLTHVVNMHLKLHPPNPGERVEVDVRETEHPGGWTYGPYTQYHATIRYIEDRE